MCVCVGDIGVPAGGSSYTQDAQRRKRRKISISLSLSAPCPPYISHCIPSSSLQQPQRHKRFFFSLLSCSSLRVMPPSAGCVYALKAKLKMGERTKTALVVVVMLLPLLCLPHPSNVVFFKARRPLDELTFSLSLSLSCLLSLLLQEKWIERERCTLLLLLL